MKHSLPVDDQEGETVSVVEYMPCRDVTHRVSEREADEMVEIFERHPALYEVRRRWEPGVQFIVSVHMRGRWLPFVSYLMPIYG